MGEGNNYTPLFETERAKGLIFYRLFALTVLVAISFVWAYRVNHIPREAENGRWAWIGLLAAELWFGFYWVLTQALRWNLVYRSTFTDRLSTRHENNLPVVDIFVCTADPVIEPPIMVMNTILSVVAYDYPSEKLNIYLSDDAGSAVTFFALLLTCDFAKHWIPYCKKFKVEPRSPAAYFASICKKLGDESQTELVAIKKLYQEMEEQMETATKLGRVPEEALSKHKGFSQWNSSYSSRRDHDTILQVKDFADYFLKKKFLGSHVHKFASSVSPMKTSNYFLQFCLIYSFHIFFFFLFLSCCQILIDGKDPDAVDVDGFQLPTVVYLAREKRPQHPHNFKAGAMNALIRVSSKISNGQVILNLDCDMYSNNSQAIRDALCFFMDEKNSHDTAFVQFPQNFENLTKNELYSTSLRVINTVELHGFDGYGGPLYIGTGCFHRRDILCGKKFGEANKIGWKKDNIDSARKQNIEELEEETKPFASFTYEKNSEWGKEMGLKYGCAVEDVITGLSIQCRGWKSVYLNPERKAFLGIAPTTLLQTLVQHKRWSEGDFQILLSECSPAWYAHGRISLGLQLAYCCACLWAANCWATLYYSVIPSLFLLKGISLFPQVSSPWFLPFAYAIFAKCTCSLGEFLWAGGTVLGWWNDQRIWVYKRTSSYLFAFMDTILKSLGFTESGFVITTKVADEDEAQRYEKEIMEFGATSPMFTILATLALLNLYCFLEMVKNLVIMGSGDSVARLFGTMSLQILLCGVLVLINLPLYQAIFLRKDKGKLPTSVAVQAFVLALLACTTFKFLY